MPLNLNVLIAGASVAGPTAAFWFAKAGARVTVIERFSQFREGGQNIDIRGIGVKVMRYMNLEDAVRDKKYAIDGFSMVRDDGTPFATMRATGDPEAQSLLSDYEILRGDLARIMYEETKDNANVRYVFGEQIVAMHEAADGGPVTVEFENGMPTATYDLVVACDGATSRTRCIGLGCGPRDYVRPLNTWAAYFTIKRDLLHGSNTGKSFTVPGGTFISAGPDPDQCGNKAGVMKIAPITLADATVPFQTARKQGDAALKDFVAQYVRGIGWKADDIVQGIYESDDFYASEIVQIKLPHLFKGRFVLAGDAGYAAGLGVGTSLAMAGAYVLVGELHRHSDDLAAGLRAYEDRMRPIIDGMQKLPPGMPGMLAPQTAWGLWARNVLFTVVAWASEMGDTAFGRAFAKLGAWFSDAFGSGDQYDLPEYFPALKGEK